MVVRVLLALALVGAACAMACGGPPAGPAGPAGAAMRFKYYVHVDREGIGIEAFRFLVPADWQVSGGIRWALDNPGRPATAHLQAASPDGRRALELLPAQPCFWTDNRMLLTTNPPGTRYFGNEVRPMPGPVEALRDMILPRFRSGVAGLRVVESKELPDLARAVGAGAAAGPGLQTGARGAMIRVEYNQGGQLVEEEIYGVVDWIAFPIQGAFGATTNVNWAVDYLFSFRAPRGQLAADTKRFQTMIGSFRLNPQWFNKYVQLVELLIRMQIRQIRHIGEISRIISQTHDEISRDMMAAYESRQAVNDRISENFSRYIRGVDAYHDPFTDRPVELPSGYRHAWATPLGEYIVTDDPNYNPNVGSNQNWQQLQPRR